MNNIVKSFIVTVLIFGLFAAGVYLCITIDWFIFVILGIIIFCFVWIFIYTLIEGGSK